MAWQPGGSLARTPPLSTSQDFSMWSSGSVPGLLSRTDRSVSPDPSTTATRGRTRTSVMKRSSAAYI